MYALPLFRVQNSRAKDTISRTSVPYLLRLLLHCHYLHVPQDSNPSSCCAITDVTARHDSMVMPRVTTGGIGFCHLMFSIAGKGPASATHDNGSLSAMIPFHAIQTNPQTALQTVPLLLSSCPTGR